MELDTLNLTQICRTCKCVTPQMRSLFETYENAHQSPRIDEMLMTCASVQVSCDDGLPAQICQICVEQLRNTFIFKRQVEQIDADLREYMKNVKVNEIKQEPQNSDLMERNNIPISEPLNPLSNLPNEQAKESNQEPCDSPVIPKIETDDVQTQDNDEMLLTCYECSKSFSTLKGLRWHKRIHISNLHKCSKCDKQYTILNHLRRHEELHTRKKVHVCKICNKTVARTEHLKRHLLTHLKAIPFSCNSCNRVFSKVGHLRNHTSKCKRDVVFPCDTCNKVFNRQDSLEVHKKMHDKQPKLLTIENLSNIEDYYRIDDCFEPQVEVTENTDEDKVKELVDMGLNDKESEKIKELVTTGTNDKESDINETSMAGGNDNDDVSSMEKASKCLENESDDSKVKVEDNLEMKDSLEDKDKTINILCDAEENSGDTMAPEYLPKKSVSHKIKSGQARLRKHPLKPSKMTVPGKRKNPLKITKVDNEEEYKEFPCPACQEIFNTMSALAKHAKIQHEGLKVYKCNECNKEFRRVNHLNTHVISHSAAKPFRCHVCSKSFNRRDTLNRHQKLHDTSNEVECDICQKAFSRSDLLVNHRAAKHGCVSGQKEQEEYQCKVCQKTFLLKSLFNRHLKFHNEHAKKFLCSECGQRFLKKDYFIIHMRRHRGEKPFKCKYCGKGFPRTTDLRVHERYHTGEKTHLCTVCGRGFGRGYDLKVHMRTHTGEKPYRCKFCDAAFVQCNDLKAHVRRHTGERFQCELCSENFLKEYLLTQHKRTVHSLDVVGNVRRLQSVQKQENPDEPTNNTSASASSA